MSGGAVIDISEDGGWAGCYVTEISDWLFEPDSNGKIATLVGTISLETTTDT